MKNLLWGVMMCIGMCSYGQHKVYYTFAVGLRGGETSGGTLKWFASETVALEAIIGYWNKSLAGTFLAEKHIEAFHRRELQWYFGGGAHIAGATGYNRWYNLSDDYYEFRDGGVGYGIDAIAGIEFKFPVIPVAMSFDLKPFVEFSSLGGAWIALDPGIGIKLAL